MDRLNGFGYLNFDVPDFVTTPGGTRKVYFRAFPQYYDSTRGWTSTYWNGYRWVQLPFLNWQWAWATASGLVNGFWMDLTNNTLTPVIYSFNIAHGYYWRVNVEYYWGYDATDHEEATNYCYF